MFFSELFFSDKTKWKFLLKTDTLSLAGMHKKSRIKKQKQRVLFWDTFCYIGFRWN